MNKKSKMKSDLFNFLKLFGENISSKFSNICGKTGKYDVPNELFQKRTPRQNRVLITWKDVLRNNLNLEQLNTFFGGVTVELKNDDLFNENNLNNDVFQFLLKHLGSNENISSIISIRSEDGNSSSSLQRRCFERLINNYPVLYDNKTVTINKNNYKDYAIKQLCSGGQGNEKWSGFLYISIKGGQQDTIETHRGQELTIFNPACEYANSDVCEDLNLVLGYFALLSIDISLLKAKNLENVYMNLKSSLETLLKDIHYNCKDFKGSLYEYCTNHYSTILYKNQLVDPIQIKKISINDFNIKTRDENSIDFTHNEAVEKNIFYWDSERKYILSPARPTNVFWSFHLSNMMQQNYTLDEYFEYEKARVLKRNSLIK